MTVFIGKTKMVDYEVGDLRERERGFIKIKTRIGNKNDNDS